MLKSNPDEAFRLLWNYLAVRCIDWKKTTPKQMSRLFFKIGIMYGSKKLDGCYKK